MQPPKAPEPRRSLGRAEKRQFARANRTIADPTIRDRRLAQEAEE